MSRKFITVLWYVCFAAISLSVLVLNISSFTELPMPDALRGASGVVATAAAAVLGLIPLIRYISRG